MLSLLLSLSLLLFATRHDNVEHLCILGRSRQRKAQTPGHCRKRAGQPRRPAPGWRSKPAETHSIARIALHIGRLAHLSLLVARVRACQQGLDFRPRPTIEKCPAWPQKAPRSHVAPAATRRARQNDSHLSFQMPQGHVQAQDQKHQPWQQEPPSIDWEICPYDACASGIQNKPNAQLPPSIASHDYEQNYLHQPAAWKQKHSVQSLCHLL